MLVWLRAEIKPDPDKLAAVKTYRVPKTAQEVRRFLGFVGYYRRFFQDFSHIAQPLTALTRKGTRVVWGHNEQAAFDELRKRLTAAPILKMPDLSQPFYIAADASTRALGRILLQRNAEGHLQPVAIISCEKDH